MLIQSKAKVRTFLVVLIAIFSLSTTMVPTSAIDLGAKAKYIISVTPTAKAAVEAAVVKAGGKIQSRYNYVFDGFTVELPKLVASALTKIPNILTIEEDRDVLGLAIQNTQTPTPTWGIDRVDQREKVLTPMLHYLCRFFLLPFKSIDVPLNFSMTHNGKFLNFLLNFLVSLHHILSFSIHCCSRHPVPVHERHQSH